MRDSFEVEWVERPSAAESSMAFGTLEGAESFFYGLAIGPGCWKHLSIERIDERGGYHPELAIGLIYEEVRP